MILYTFGFYLCWIMPSFIIHFANQGTAIMRMSYILLPFQGFFNMIIFLAPKCAKYQKDHPGTWMIMAYVYLFYETFSVPFRWLYELLFGSRQMQAIRRRRSSRILNPFRLSSNQFSTNFSWRGTLQGETELTTQALFDDDDDDGLGFNGFNEAICFAQESH